MEFETLTELRRQPGLKGAWDSLSRTQVLAQPHFSQAPSWSLTPATRRGGI